MEQHITLLSTLNKEMSQALSRWNQRGVSPSLSETSNATKSWLGSIEKLENYDGAQSEGLHVAKRLLNEAWDDRANKSGTLDRVKSASAAIKSVLDESLSISDAKTDRSYSSMMTGTNHVVTLDQRLESAKRTIKGLIAANGYNTAYPIQIEEVRNKIADVGMEYSSNPRINELAIDIYETLGRNQSRIKSSGRMNANGLSEVVNGINQLQQLINSNSRPDGSALDMTPTVRESYLEKVNQAGMVFNQRGYITPIKAIRDAHVIMENVFNGLSRYSAFSERRLAERALEHLEVALKNAPAIKSEIGTMRDPWQHPIVLHSVEQFLNRISEIQISLSE